MKAKSSKAIADGIEMVFRSYNRYRKGIEQYRRKASWEEVGKRNLELYNFLK